MRPALKRNRRSSSARTRVPTQREVLRDVMLSAAQCDTWLTLRELALLTHYGEASISAQLRHLRKGRYGAFAIEKRQRRAFAVVGDEARGPVVWEYQLRRGVRHWNPQGRRRSKVRSPSTRVMVRSPKSRRSRGAVRRAA